MGIFAVFRILGVSLDRWKMILQIVDQFSIGAPKVMLRENRVIR